MDGVDDEVGAGEVGAEGGAVAHVGGAEVDAEGDEAGGVGRGMDQGDEVDVVTGQFVDEVPAEEAVGAGDDDSHRSILRRGRAAPEAGSAGGGGEAGE